MAHDMAEDFRPYGVAVISLWMGLLRTERTAPLFANAASSRYADLMATSESAEFPGRVIAALAAAPDRMDYTGRVHVNAELAQTLGVTDIDGAQPASHRATTGNP